MRKIEINNNLNPNFIGAWNIDNTKLCKDIIDFFEKNKNLQKKGGTSDASNNKKVKSTTDISIRPIDLKDKNFNVFNNYMKELHNCYVDYQKQWPFLKSMLNDIQIPPFNIQKYNPGDHFSTVHSERTSLNTLHRLFAFMTYLNDVEDGGETHFTHYKLKIKPEIGKTIIWPAEWTHAHSGEILKSGTKYIVTGWMNFPI